MQLSSFIVIVSFFFSQAALATERESIGNEIKKLAKDLSCDFDSECKSIGYGSRGCGGFSEYILYSTKSVNDDYMQSLSKRYFELDEQNNLDVGGMSICTIEEPRKSACLHNSCIDLGDESNAITPLHWAVLKGDTALIYQLISQGLNIDIKAGTFGDTPLQFAIRTKKTFEIIKLLIDLGADINASNHAIEVSRNTPLHLAVSSKKVDVIKLLLALGANKKAGGEASPLYYAMFHLRELPEYKNILDLLTPKSGGEFNGLILSMTPHDIKASVGDSTEIIIKLEYVATSSTRAEVEISQIIKQISGAPSTIEIQPLITDSFVITENTTKEYKQKLKVLSEGIYQLWTTAKLKKSKVEQVRSAYIRITPRYE